MKSSQFVLRAVVATVATLGLVAAIPVSATAAPATPAAAESTIAGYTKGEFVSAAAKQGVDLAVAQKAWGNREAMAAIPVSSVATPGRSTSDESLEVGTFALTRQYTGTCQKWWNNAFGAEIMRMKINKQWYYDGHTLKNPTAQWYATTGFPYAYNGLVGQNDYFSTAYEDPRGKHTTYRQGAFTENFSGEQFNGSVTFVAKLGGAYDCSYYGGVN